MSAPSLPFGPWTAGVEPVELRAAESDPDAALRALELLDQVPSLTRRRLLSTFGALTWPRQPRGGRP
jgi:hypothetical protein